MREKGNKDSFNFLESFNRQSLSICYFLLTTSLLLNPHILVLQQKRTACLKRTLLNPHRQLKKQFCVLAVFVVDCVALTDV